MTPARLDPSLALLPLIPAGHVAVSESGIASGADVERVVVGRLGELRAVLEALCETLPRRSREVAHVA